MKAKNAPCLQILRRSDVSTTQHGYIMPTATDAVAAMERWEQSQVQGLESVLFPK